MVIGVEDPRRGWNIANNGPRYLFIYYFFFLEFFFFFFFFFLLWYDPHMNNHLLFSSCGNERQSNRGSGGCVQPKLVKIWNWNVPDDWIRSSADVYRLVLAQFSAIQPTDLHRAPWIIQTRAEMNDVVTLSALSSGGWPRLNTKHNNRCIIYAVT